MDVEAAAPPTPLAWAYRLSCLVCFLVHASTAVAIPLAYIYDLPGKNVPWIVLIALGAFDAILAFFILAYFLCEDCSRRDSLAEEARWRRVQQAY